AVTHPLRRQCRGRRPGLLAHSLKRSGRSSQSPVAVPWSYGENDEIRMTNAEGNPKPENTSLRWLQTSTASHLSGFVILPSSFRSFLSLVSPNFGEDQMQFLCFEPERSRLRLQFRHCPKNHPKKMLGFPRFLSASPDAL